VGDDMAWMRCKMDESITQDKDEFSYTDVVYRTRMAWKYWLGTNKLQPISSLVRISLVYVRIS
jgi:hypothetical protein